MNETVGVSVVITTIGRPAHLAACLGSLALCEPAPAEVVVVDQSDDDATRAVAARSGPPEVRVVGCSARGVSRGRNAGLEAARGDVVAMTDDDCTVAPDWAGTAWRLTRGHPRRIVTGRVLAAGDPRHVPSTKDVTVPRDYTGERECGALYTNNAAFPRAEMLAVGGFDERLAAAEDNDVCYRWLRSGRELWFRPELVVRHHAWRSAAEMRALYRSYWRAQGTLYAKHLRDGDPAILGFLAADAYRDLRATAGAAARRRAEWWDPRRGAIRGVAAGLARGWPEFGR